MFKEKMMRENFDLSYANKKLKEKPMTENKVPKLTAMTLFAFRVILNIF